MSEFLIPEEKKQEITERIITSSAPRVSRQEIEDIVAREVDKLRAEVNAARDALLTLLTQCRILARWKAGNLRLWQKEFRENINAAEHALGRPVTQWPGPRKPMKEIENETHD